MEATLWCRGGSEGVRNQSGQEYGDEDLEDSTGSILRVPFSC